MYSEQQYKKDLAFIERMDNRLSEKAIFLMYFLPLVACLAAHALYLTLFAFSKIWAMVIFNVFSVGFYVMLIILAKKVKEKLNLVYATMAEIIIHAAAATVYVGLKPDFCMFLLMIIPLAFLMPNKNRVIPFIVMSISVPIYGLLRFLYLTPGREKYDMAEQSYNTVFYVINIIVGSFVLVYVALIFTRMRMYQDCKLRVQTEQLRIMASTDPLTKLNNRRQMNEKLAEISAGSKKSGRGYVIGLGDIDDFKRINDTYGHTKGDEVLSRVADIIRKNVPEGGYVSRWGGEEFLFILPGTGLDGGIACAEEIINRVSREKFRAGAKRFSVTMTIGVCKGNPHDNIEKIISLADDRLYDGKNNGKNRVEH